MTDKDESLELVKHAIREAGLRATPARIAILQLLSNSISPQPHSVVAEKLSPLGIDSATVFRNLNSMTQVGLLRRAELGDHVWRFEESLRTQRNRHNFRQRLPNLWFAWSSPASGTFGIARHTMSTRLASV